MGNESEAKQRLREERSELFSKICKLENFSNTQAFFDLKEVQRDLLKEQLQHMLGYYRAVNARLKNWD